MSSKAASGISSRPARNAVLNAQTTQRSGRRNPNEPKPLRRTPGVEEDDEIVNYSMQAEGVSGEVTGKKIEASVSGTEHQSIVEKMDWWQMKGLYDMVIKQKDEASRESNSIVIDASRFNGPYDALSDLSDNTSRETVGFESGRGHEAPPARASARRHAAPVTQPLFEGKPTPGALTGAEAEYLSSIVNISDSLSVGALEGLVSYLAQVLHIKTRTDSELSHPDSVPVATTEEFPTKGTRSNSTLGTQSPSPRQTPHVGTMQNSPHLLSQSAPSSFFAGAIPAAANGNHAQTPTNSKRQDKERPTSDLRRTMSREQVLQNANYQLYHQQQHSSSRRDEAVEDDDDEILSLSAVEKEHAPGSTVRTTTPTHHRTMSTPSPKHKRIFATTPTKTPPIRSGAIPPVAQHLIRDAGDSDCGIPTAQSAPQLNVASLTPKSCTPVKKRGSQSPPVIAHAPSVSTPAVPIASRSRETSASSVASTGASNLKISLPFGEAASMRESKKRPNHNNNNLRGAVMIDETMYRQLSAARLSELHLSPCSAFDDRSVNSGSSASYYSNNYQ